MPKLFSAILAAGALAASGAQAQDWRTLPQGSFEVAQTADPQVYQLEEEVRTLNGKVEELTFQLLELQEQIRRMQENNEFRFQELENGGQSGSGDGAGSGDHTDAGPSAQPLPPATDTAQAAPDQAAPGQVVPDQAASAQQPATPEPSLAAAGDDQPKLGAPPRDLGTLTIDGSGTVVDGTVDFSQQQIDSAIDGSAVASVNAQEDPEAYYREGYRHVLDGDYATAEGIFRSFAELFPNDPLSADARFWLAESVRAQGRLNEAVEMFIGLRQSYPDMQKAPETMLKIGQIMNELGDRDVACVTFADAETSYPNMSDAIRTRIRAERAKAQC